MSQRELLEERPGGAVEQRTSKTFAATDDVDQPALVERLENRAGADATNLFDLPSADRLPVGDYRQCFERRRREPLGPCGQLRPLDRFGVLGPGEDLPAARDLDELDAMAFV